MSVAEKPFTAEVPLSWSRQDIEQRLFFHGGRFTDVNNKLSFLLGCLATGLASAALFAARETAVGMMFWGPKQDSLVPFEILFFCCWSAAIIVLKTRKLALQKRALEYIVVPASRDFVLSAATVQTVMDRIYSTVDDPKQFVLFNRIVIALSNLKNLGQVTEVDGILRSQADYDEVSLDTTYSMLGGFIWAIPVLGFIGTVVGLSAAIGGFTTVLGSAGANFDKVKESLQDVTSGLSTAFETTLLGLVGALVIQLYQTHVKKAELHFLEQCAEYCSMHIVNKLRIMPYEKHGG